LFVVLSYHEERQMGRKALVLGFVLAVTAIAAGCGGGSSAGNASSSAAPKSATDYAGLKGKPFELLCSACSADLVSGLQASFLPDFAKKTGVSVKPVDTFCCGIDKLKAQVNGGNVQWDAINFATVTDFLLAKQAGLLAPIDTNVVPVSKLRSGTYDRYGYDEYRYGAVIGWNTKAFPGSDHPTKLADLLDTQRFPGKRCMYKYPQFGGTLEAPLLADGVAPSSIYPLDVNRALTKLSAIKNDIVWWSSGSQAAQFLASGVCKLGVMWNGVAQAAIKRGEPLDISWNQAVITTSVNAIPKDAPDMKASQLWMAEQINNQAAESTLLQHVAYTLPLKNASIPGAVSRFAPEGPNLANAIEEDDTYYFKNADAINKRFNDWLVTGH
jgi:putative spermidine/putrescine transport system substrate-binding protein